MIFKRGQVQDNVIVEIKHKGDKITFTHTGTLDEAMEDAYVNRLYSDNGFTDKRHFRKVAVIPAWVFAVHPEFNQDPDLALDWVKRNGDGIGDRFRAVTGRF